MADEDNNAPAVPPEPVAEGEATADQPPPEPAADDQVAEKPPETETVVAEAPPEPAEGEAAAHKITSKTSPQAVQFQEAAAGDGAPAAAGSEAEGTVDVEDTFTGEESGQYEVGEGGTEPFEGKPPRKVSLMMAEDEELMMPDGIEGYGEDKSKSLISQLDQTEGFGISTSKLSSDMLDMKRAALDKKKTKTLGSVISIRKGDQAFLDRQKAPKYQNSYKLESDKPFNPEKVEMILKEVLEEALNELQYDSDKVPKQAKWASSAIRAKVKAQEYDRYKIVCYVSIGEKLCQDVCAMMRFLWDSDRDKYAMYIHENMQLYAMALCFGIYYE